MSKKLHSKLLSVILAIAICCATVFGCMLNVSAAYSGTYTFSGGIAAYGAKQASVDLTFDLTDGFAGGDFALTNTTDFTDVSVKVKGGATKDGSAFDASNIVAQFKADASGTYLGYVTFWTNNLKYYTSLTFELTYTMKDWVQHGGVKYAVDIAELVIATEYDSIEPTFTGSAGYIHSHHAWLNNENLDPTTAGDGYHLVYDTTCHICLSQHPIKQVMPNYTQIDGATGFNKYPNGNLGISAVNVLYNDDGTVNLMIHGYSPYYRGGNYIVVTDTEGKIYDKYELKTNTTSQYAGNVLVDNAQVWTLENFSARDINTELLFTMFYNDNGTIRASSTVSFSLADYCVNVVGGNAVWTDDATAEQIEADKDVAAALYYYGAAIDESVFDTSTGSSSDSENDQIDYIEKTIVEYNNDIDLYNNYKTFDDFVASLDSKYNASADGSENNPYIITKGIQVLYLTVRASAADTTGRYFKVADHIAGFNFNGNASISINSTAAEVKAAWEASGSNKHGVEHAVFSGTFDGNGATFYNLYKTGNAAGFFTALGSNAVVKNLTVSASVFNTNGQYANGAGGIFAQYKGDWGKSVKLQNCRVENCYIVTTPNDKYSSAYYHGAGALGGYAGGAVLTIDGCFVRDNIFSSVGIGTHGGFIATGYNYSTIKNSVALGTTPYSTWETSVSFSDGVHQTSYNNSTYANVYTDQAKNTCYTDKANTSLRTFEDTQIKVISASEIKGSNVVKTLGYDSTVWMDTNGYPDFANHHSLAIGQYDETGHTYMCAVKINGVLCDCSMTYTEAHNMVESEDGKKATCSACGYSEEIVGNVNYVDKITVKWTTGDKPQSASLSGSGQTADDPFIITTPGELFYVAMYAGANSAGRFYKIADNIGVFDMNNNGFGYTGNAFQGVLDGNGVEIINFNTSGWHTGLFPLVGGNVTIENIKITGATIESSGDNAGGFIGTTSGTTNLNINNCIIADSVIKGKGRAGAIIGSAGGQPITVNNCFVKNNTVVANCDNTKRYESDGVTEYTAAKYASEFPQNAVIGYGYTATRVLKNSIVIGNDPSIRVSSASNVYTDITPTSNLSGITKLTTNDLTGENALTNMTFDDMSAWFATDSYPELSAFHKFAYEYIDEATHRPICIIRIDSVPCTLCGEPEEHSLKENEDGTANECACGYSEEIIGRIEYTNKGTIIWDGNVAATPGQMDTTTWNITAEGQVADEEWFQDSLCDYSGDGSSEDSPYIITTAAQLYYVAQLSRGYSAGKYYKIDDSIGVIDLSNKNWGLRDNSAKFQGNFDGNGATIINFKTTSGYKTGLFPNVQGNVTIKNLKISGADISGITTNAGLIIGDINGTGSNILVEKCIIVDSSLTASSGAGAVVGATAYNNISINNCFISGNTIKTTSTDATQYLSNAVVGYGYGSYTREIKNSIVIGNDTSIRTTNVSNVYNAETAQKGANALNNMSLSDDIWFATDSYPDLSVFHKMQLAYIDENTHGLVCGVIIDGVQCTTCGPVKSHNMVEDTVNQIAECECGYSYEIKGIYSLGLPELVLNRIKDNKTFTDKFATNASFTTAYGADNYHDITDENCWLYATSLNLKVNPHIAFTFVFNKDYKTNRGDISVTFKTADGSVYNTEAVETEGTLGTNWVNNSGAGRYHLYRFKDLPVKKLCQRINVTLNYGNETRDFGSYSAAGYAINAMNAGADYVNHANAAMALVYYSEMLAARYGA